MSAFKNPAQWNELNPKDRIDPATLEEYKKGFPARTRAFAYVSQKYRELFVEGEITRSKNQHGKPEIWLKVTKVHFGSSDIEGLAVQPGQLFVLVSQKATQ